MKIFVLLKRTMDPEEKIEVQADEVVASGAEYIVNPYDEFAIEEAIRLRDQHGGEVTVVSVGSEETEKELRTALAMGCDHAVLIEDDSQSSDASVISNILADYLKDKQADLILAGYMAIDGGTGQTGPRIAELLDIPCITAITKFEWDGRQVIVERDVEGDIEVIETSLPLLVTAQQGLNEPRYPSLPGIMKAKKKPITRLKSSDINKGKYVAKTEIREVFLPAKKEAGKRLSGNPEEQVKELISLLQKEAKVL